MSFGTALGANLQEGRVRIERSFERDWIDAYKARVAEILYKWNRGHSGTKGWTG